MGVGGSVIVFAMAWWVAFIALLPIGVRSQAEAGEIAPGTDPAAPVAPQLARKALWATVIAFIVWLGAFAVIEGQLVTMAEMIDVFGLER